MTVLFRLTTTGELRQLASGNAHRPSTWIGPLWLANLVARQLVEDGCSEAQVHETVPIKVRSAVTDGDIPTDPVVGYRAQVHNELFGQQSRRVIRL